MAPRGEKMGDKGENSKKTYRSFMAKYRSVMQNEHGWDYFGRQGG